MKGRNHTEYSKRKMSLSKSKMSDDSKNKMRLSKIGSKKKNSSSIYHDVAKRLANNRRNIYWRACLFYNKQFITIGNFASEIEAARAYDKYVKENNLLHPLNF